MFGGLAFMVNGHMCCGIVGEELMVRVGPDLYQSSLAQPHTREMEFTGKPLKGMVYVGTEGLATEHQLGQWVQRGLAYVSTLPAKWFRGPCLPDRYRSGLTTAVFMKPAVGD